MIQPSDIHTLTEFKRNSSELLERLEESGRPHVLTVEGRPKAVLLSVETFERMAERAGALESVRRALEDAGADRTLPPEELAAALRQRLFSELGAMAERQRTADNLREALELLGFGYAVMEQNLRREDPRASDAGIQEGLAAWKAEADLGEEAPGFLVRSPDRLKKLLRDPA